MQFRHFFVYLIFRLLVFSGLSVQAQQVTTNEDGEKVIIYPDGSWKYFDEKATEQTVPQESVANPEESKKERKQREKEAKRQKRLAKKMNKRARASEDTAAQPEKKSKRKRAKKKKTPKAELVVDPVAEIDARREAMYVAERASAEEMNAMNEVEQATFKRASLEEEINEANTNVAYSVEDIIALEEKLGAAKKEEKGAKARLKAAKKHARKMKQMIDMPKAKRDKMLAKMNGTPNENVAEKSSKKKRKRQKGEEVFVNATPATDMEGNINTRKFKSRPHSKDVMLNPPELPCQYAFDNVDEFSGKRRRDLASQQLFAHTNEQLRPYMKGRDYITCNGYLSSISGSVRSLFLQFTILSENAQREFGVLEKGSILTVKFIDGSTVRLYNDKTDIGVVDPLERSVTFRGRYTIDSSTEKALRKNEVDKVRVVWGTGFEDYEVYELDFFINQFRCLNQ